MLTGLLSTGQHPSLRLGNRGGVWPPVWLSTLTPNTIGFPRPCCLVKPAHALPSPGTPEYILLILSCLCFRSTLASSTLTPILNQGACHECLCPLSLQSRVSLDSCARPSTKPWMKPTALPSTPSKALSHPHPSVHSNEPGGQEGRPPTVLARRKQLQGCQST